MLVQGKILQSLICFRLQAKMWHRPLLHYFNMLRAETDPVCHTPLLSLRSSLVSQRPLLLLSKFITLLTHRESGTQPGEEPTLQGRVITGQGPKCSGVEY